MYSTTPNSVPQLTTCPFQRMIDLLRPRGCLVEEPLSSGPSGYLHHLAVFDAQYSLYDRSPFLAPEGSTPRDDDDKILYPPGVAG